MPAMSETATRGESRAIDFPQPTTERKGEGLRRLTRYYPFRNGAYAFNNLLGRLGADRDEPNWVVVPAWEEMPKMVLNLSSRHERKIYLFPRAYGRDYARAPLTSFLRRALQPGQHYYEIGANVGFYALLAAELVGPEGRVYAFEPDPLICETLRRTIAANAPTCARAVQIALADKNGKLTFYRGRNNPSSSLVAADPANRDRYIKSIDVEAMTMDDWVAKEGVPTDRIGALKVDVEGAEVATIGGMVGTLRKAGLPPVYAEVRGPKGSTRAPNTFAGVLAHLEPLGYRPYRWTTKAVGPIAPESVVHREDILFLPDGHRFQ